MLKNEIMRQLPAVDDILNWNEIQQLSEEYNRTWVKKAVKTCINERRERLLAALEEKDASSVREMARDLTAKNGILQEIKTSLLTKSRPQLAPAVNATGIVVHTNLGRSLYSDRAREMIEMASRHYTTLEIDRKTGERGSRYDNVSNLLCELTGAQAAFVVNNNAAAVLLALSTFAEGKEVIISRGELVEIGGSFRIPDVMEQGGADLVEVGTTNKVYVGDYEQAINEDTSLLLKVHTSNYQIMGFTEDVEVEQLKNLGQKYEIPVLDDLGSGTMFDMRDFGLEYEPTLPERVAAGGDIITCSGDKILGGPQAGIILGRKKYIEQMKNNPLTRAIRVDKITLAALEGTLKSYYNQEQAVDEIPTLQMINKDENELKSTARELKNALTAETSDGEISIALEKDASQVGGGAFPVTEIPTWTVSVDFGHDPENEARRLRAEYPPIFCRLADNKMMFDVRTLVEGDIAKITSAWKKLGV